MIEGHNGRRKGLAPHGSFLALLLNLGSLWHDTTRLVEVVFIHGAS